LYTTQNQTEEVLQKLVTKIMIKKGKDAKKYKEYTDNTKKLMVKHGFTLLSVNIIQLN
jgi:hypothetical protein